MTEAIAPPQVVGALSTLNAHARAHGCGRDAVYLYKILIAKMYAYAGQANARPIGMMSKCLYCDGTGKFISQYDGPTDEACRKCSRTGYVFLRFIETTIEGHGWHHPWYSGGDAVFRIALDLGRAEILFMPATRSLQVTKPGELPIEMHFSSPSDWRPNLPGEKFEGERAAELFNTVEEWVLGLRYVEPNLRWDLERAQLAAQSYQLDLGRIGEACHYCGSPERRTGQVHSVRPFHWSVNCCEQHQRMPVDAWDKKVPPQAITPAVAKWAQRRGWPAPGTPVP
jgi:hypothetical protein